ncbi:MAG: fibronectin type III domain-containing protein [Candidatus Microsaccharimonas sp.]
MRRITREKGFTLIEMLVIAPIVILAIGAFITVIISMTGEVLASRASNNLTYNVQDAINRIEQDTKLSIAFLAQNNVSLASGSNQGFDNNDTSNFVNVGGTTGSVLILNMLVTNGSPLSSSSGIVYLANQPNACASSQVQDNTPMTMNVIYFVKTDPATNLSTLWRRTMMPANYNTPAARCSTPFQQPSCAPGVTSSLCATNDVKLVEGVPAGGFFVQYFTAANSDIPDAVSSDAGATVADRNAALRTTPTIAVSIAASQSVAGKTIERSATLRATRLDINASTIADTLVQSALSGAPSNLSLATNSSSQVTASWDAPSGVPTSYTLQYSARSDMSSPTTVSNITGTSQTISGLTSAKVYFFRVSATNSFGTTGYSGVELGATSGGNTWSAYTKIAAVGDWNKDGSNDVIGYKSNGDIELHLGANNATMGGAIMLGNIGTTVRNFIGPGTPLGGTAPVLWWANTSGAGFMLTSDGAYGVTGSAVASGTGWNTVTSVFTAPRFLNTGAATIIGKAVGLTIYTLAANGTVTGPTAYGSGWDAAFPGDNVFGSGEFTGDSNGDIIGIAADGTMTIYAGTGTGTTGSTYSGGTGWLNNRVIGGWDYSGDSRADILRYNTGSGILGIYPGNGAAYFTSPYNTPIP